MAGKSCCTAAAGPDAGGLRAEAEVRRRRPAVARPRRTSGRLSPPPAGANLPAVAVEPRALAGQPDQRVAELLVVLGAGGEPSRTPMSPAGITTSRAPVGEVRLGEDRGARWSRRARSRASPATAPRPARRAPPAARRGSARSTGRPPRRGGVSSTPGTERAARTHGSPGTPRRAIRTRCSRRSGSAAAGPRPAVRHLRANAPIVVLKFATRSCSSGSLRASRARGLVPPMSRERSCSGLRAEQGLGDQRGRALRGDVVVRFVERLGAGLRRARAGRVRVLLRRRLGVQRR